MKSSVFTVTAIAMGLSASGAYASKDPAPLLPVVNAAAKATVYTLEPKPEGVTCGNGTVAWPAHMRFPAGLYRTNAPLIDAPTAPPGVKPREQTYTLAFDVLKEGRLTNVRAGSAPFGLYNNAYLPAWAAAWSLGAQDKALTGCKMEWTVKTDHTPEIAAPLIVEALHLRNAAQGTPRAKWRSEACTDVARRLKTRVLPDLRAFRRLPGQPQWLIMRYDVAANGKLSVGSRLKTEALPENADAVFKALSQASYYDGAPASECLSSYVISPDVLPADDTALWAELSALNGSGSREATDEAAEEKTCPVETLRQVLTFRYRSELYPAQAARLRIEGVAFLTYDIAPWGQAKVRSQWSHPLPEFGRAAETMLMQSKFNPSATGLSGCRLKVRFVLSDDRTPTVEAASERMDAVLED